MVWRASPPGRMMTALHRSGALSENAALMSCRSLYVFYLVICLLLARVQSCLLYTSPGETARAELPFAVPQAPGEYTVDASLCLRENARWAAKGHCVAVSYTHLDVYKRQGMHSHK